MENGQWSLLRCYINNLLHFDAQSLAPVSVRITFTKDQLRKIVRAKTSANIEAKCLNEILKEINFQVKTLENDTIEITQK